MSKPRALDLFSCAGGATKGLQRAGFHVTGVDIRPQPRYCGDAFFQADALTFPLDGFDFIWASPPCQHYSGLTPKGRHDDHPDLIDGVRDLLAGAGVPYAIENVAGARRKLRNPIMLCGSMFGLRTQRHRYFETSFPINDLLPVCDHSQMPLLVTTASAGSRKRRRDTGEPPKSVKNAPAAYDIDWMVHSELAEAIPPAYAEFIGRAALQHMQLAVAA